MFNSTQLIVRWLKLVVCFLLDCVSVNMLMFTDHLFYTFRSAKGWQLVVLILTLGLIWCLIRLNFSLMQVWSLMPSVSWETSRSRSKKIWRYMSVMLSWHTWHSVHVCVRESLCVQCQCVMNEFLLQTKCFICGIGSDYFDTTPHGFETHTLEEHNLANYLWVTAPALPVSHTLCQAFTWLTNVTWLSYSWARKKQIQDYLNH